MKLGKFIVMFVLTWMVSMYVFPITFIFFPPSLNTKMVLAVLGIVFFALRAVRDKEFSMSRRTITSAVFAVVFSLWCLYSITANNTVDDSYTTYYMSFAVWLGGAFAVCSMIKGYHGKVDLQLLTNYLATVCVGQCALALMIDNIPSFQRLVDSYVNQGQEFFQEVNRLYGIGAALDPAGIRFAAVLVLISHQIATNAQVGESKKLLTIYIVSFIAITIVGNMIARTTTVGTLLGVGYMLWKVGISQKGRFTKRQSRFYGIMLTLIAITVVLGTYLYRTNPIFRADIRFAFEGFFNWVETGRFSTGSTDKLNSTMWIWPTDTRGWLIGTGIFGNFAFGTDIGYCRFVLYCGVIGMALFSAFFIYNDLSIISKFRNSRLLALLLMALTYIVWLKVATDIFLINALLFCIDGDYDDDAEEDADSILEENPGALALLDEEYEEL